MCEADIIGGEAGVGIMPLRVSSRLERATVIPQVQALLQLVEAVPTI